MADFFFYLFSALTLGAAVAVVFSRNPVNAAMFLIVSFISMASLFILLEAYFLAAVQVLVYAGAVVVLFLFIVMLLDVEQEEKRKPTKLTWIASAIGLLILVTGVGAVISSRAVKESPEFAASASQATLKTFGNELFTTYLLPMQVTGFLLLVAMIGVIVLSKRMETN